MTDHAFKNGKPDELLNPVDEDGKLCGVADRADYQYLYYIVEVEKLTKSNNTAIPATQRRLASLGEGFTFTTHALCVKECPPLIESTFNCKPTTRISEADCKTPATDQQLGYYGYGTKALFGKFCFPDANQLPANFSQQLNSIIGDFGIDDVQDFLEDVRDAKQVYFYCLGTCFVVALVYTILLRFFSKILVWISIFATAAGLLALSLFLKQYYNEYYGPTSDQTRSQTVGKIIKVAYIVLFCMTGLFVLMVLCMWRNIQVSIGVLKTSAVIVMRNIQTLIIPFVSLFVILGYIGAWLVGLGYLISCANITQPKDGSQLKSITLNGKDELKWQIAVYVFGLFWVSELLSAIFMYSLIVAICTWYFSSTYRKRGNFSLV